MAERWMAGMRDEEGEQTAQARLCLNSLTLCLFLFPFPFFFLCLFLSFFFSFFLSFFLSSVSVVGVALFMFELISNTMVVYIYVELGGWIFFKPFIPCC